MRISLNYDMLSLYVLGLWFLFDINKCNGLDERKVLVEREEVIIFLALSVCLSVCDTVHCG